MLTAQKMRRVEVWSALQGAGGLRLAILVNVVACVASVRTDGDDRLQLTTNIGGGGESSLIEFAILRISQDDATFDEWVISAVARDSSTGITTVDCEPVAMLLGRQGAIVGQKDGANVVRYDLELTGLTPQQIIDTFVIPTLVAAGSGWAVRGVIDATDPIDLTLSWDSPLAVIKRIAEITSTELQVRRTGTDALATYAIDLLSAIGDTTVAAVPSVVTESGVSSGGIGHVTDGDIISPAWHTDTAIAGAYVQFDLGVARAIAAVRFFTQLAASAPAVWKARSSDDGAAWTDRATNIGTIPNGWNGRSFPAVTARYWRLELTNTPGVGPWNTELEFVLAAAVADVRVRKNLLGTKQRRDGGPQSTRVYPRGADEGGYHATMSRAVWQVVTNAGGTVTLADPIGGAGPFLYSGQLVGAKIRKIDGTLSGAITATDATLQQLQCSGGTGGMAVGDLVQFRNADGSDITCLETTDGAKASNVLDVADVPTTNNVVPNPAARQYSNPAISPDGWGNINGAAISKNTTAPFFKTAGQSVHVVAGAAGRGIQSSSGYVYNTFADQQAYGSGFATIWVVSGQVKVELVLVKADTTTVMRPLTPNVASSTTLGQWEDLGVAGEDFKAAGAVQAAVRITALGGAAEFYVDAVQVTESSSQLPFVEGSGGTRLWQAANEQLRVAGGPALMYDIPFVDLARLNSATYGAEAVTLGADVRVTDDRIPIAILTRIISVERDFVTPGASKLVLSTLADDLTGTLERPTRPARRDPVTTGTGGSSDPGSTTPIAAPAIGLSWEIEDPNGLPTPVLLVTFTPPGVAGFAGLMIAVRGSSGNTYANVAPLTDSPIRLTAKFGSTYDVQAWAVNKAGVKSTTPSTNSITIPANQKISRGILFLDPSTFVDDGYAIKSTTNDGKSTDSGVKESGGKFVNRLLAKALAGDVDTLDGVPEGTSFRRINATNVTSGDVDLGGSSGVRNRYATSFTRSSVDSTGLASIVGNLNASGNATSAMQESGGKPINRLLAKAIAGDPDSLDGVVEGTSFKRTIASRVSSGKPLIDFGENIHVRPEVDVLRQSPVTAEAQINNFLTNGGTLSQWNGANGIAFGTIEYDVYVRPGGIVDVLLYDSVDGASKPNGYMFRLDSRSGQSSGQILRVTSGTWSAVGTAKTAYNPVNPSDISGWHRVRVKAIGGGSIGQYDIYIDGKWSWTLQDNTYACNSGLLYYGIELFSEAYIRPSVDASVTAAKITAKVGGNNEVPNSSFENGATGWSLYNNGPESASSSIESGSPFHGIRHWRTTWAVTNTSQKGVFCAAAAVGFKTDVWYTLSWYAKVLGSPGGSYRMIIAWNHAPDITQTILNPVLTTGWQRFAYRFKWNGGSTVDNAFFISIDTGAPANSIDIDAIQLEQSEVPSAYTPKGDELYGTDLKLISGVAESGGKSINRLLAKSLSGDPDSLDGTQDGVTYRRMRSVLSAYGPVQMLYQNTNVTTVITSDVSLASFSLPAGSLSTDGMSLRITVAGTWGGVSDAFYVKFGSTIVVQPIPVGPPSPYRCEILITRTGATSQRYNALRFSGASSSANQAAGTTAETMSGAITIDFRGNATSTHTLTIDHIIIEYLGV